MAAADGGGGDTASSEPWEPLSSVDFGILGFVATFQAAALLVCVHLLWWRKWPPYVTKNVNLVVIATTSGVLWTFAMAVSCGFIERKTGDVLAACDLERFLTWSTLGVHTVAFFIRVYRMWRILIKHDDNMWRTEHQILLLSSVSLIPVLATWAMPDTGYFDEVANTCYSTSSASLVTLGMDFIGFLGICFLWFVCVRQLKSVRKQFNEYQTMKRTLLYTTGALFSYAGVVLFVLGDDLTMQRRVAIFYPFLTTYILLWGSIREPFLMKMLGDDEYLWSYTKGFSELPSPAQLKASLAEQLSVDQLREEFRRYVKARVAQELVEFYLDSLDREEITGFFERQAVTMRIVEQFIRDGAPDQVNISAECRDKILATDVTAYDIFDDARKEVLCVMETNFQRDFVTSEGYQRMLYAAEDEQRELRLLRAGGIMPLGTPPLPVLAAQQSPFPISPPAATGSTSRPTPLSPPLIAGIVSAIKKLPFLAQNARAVSESRRRQRSRRSRDAGRARIGGAARVSADAAATGVDGSAWGRAGVSPRSVAAFSVPGERWGGREAQGADVFPARGMGTEENESAAVVGAPSVAGREEDFHMARKNSHGLGGGGGGAGGWGVGAASRGGGDDGGADGGAGVGAVAATAPDPRGRDAGTRLDARSSHVVHSRSHGRGGDCSFGQRGGDPRTTEGPHEGGVPLRVAVPPRPSSSALSVSTSPSGTSRRRMSSESPSIDSLRGLHLSSLPRRSGGGGLLRNRGRDAGGGDRVDADTAAGSEETLARTGTAEEPAAARAVMKYEYRNPDSNTAAAAAAAAATGTERELKMAAYASESGNRLPPLALPSGESGGGGGGSSDVFDWVPREDGVEGLDVLSSVTTEDSPDWVRFSDWIRNGTSGEVAPGGRGGAGCEAKLSGDVEEGFRAASTDGDHGVDGRPGEVLQPSRSWDSGGSSWSNVEGTSAGESDVAEVTAVAPETPPSAPSAEQA